MRETMASEPVYRVGKRALKFVEEPGLADTGFPGNTEDLSSTFGDPLEQITQQSVFDRAADKHLSPPPALVDFQVRRPVTLPSNTIERKRLGLPCNRNVLGHVMDGEVVANPIIRLCRDHNGCWRGMSE